MSIKDDLTKALDLAQILFDGYELLERILDMDDDPNATLTAVKAALSALRHGIHGDDPPQVTRAMIDELISEAHAKQTKMREASDAALREKFGK